MILKPAKNEKKHNKLFLYQWNILTLNYSWDAKIVNSFLIFLQQSKFLYLETLKINDVLLATTQKWLYRENLLKQLTINFATFIV